MTLHTYLPQDRLRTLTHNQSLPDRTSGAALFADISGFTQLTESLTQELGARLGMEELTRQINTVYDALVNCIEQHGGSVIGFAGDSITCWFDDSQPGPEPKSPAAAIFAALEMQSSMRAFPRLALKVAVASGPARRFLVGNPEIHYLDALAGATVTRTATGEHLAEKGEVLADEATASLLGDGLITREWRVDSATGDRFAVVGGFSITDSSFPVRQSSSTSPQPPLAVESLRPFILPAVYERELAGQGFFLTEFRPCAVLFVRFLGIDYDADDARDHLDVFIQQLQAVATRFDGALLQLTIGDKGSYVYINFGALSVHEDDPYRAVRAALELKKLSHLHLQMGITQGVMRVGAYGGQTRHTYGALGDNVNLAARLMQVAGENEILISDRVQKTLASDFIFEPRQPLLLKGKAEPMTPYAVIDELQKRAIRLQEPVYALPMVGRQEELRLIKEKLDLALQSHGQVIGIVAEAGMGKSRLVAEVIHNARKKGFAGYGGACQSSGTSTPYLVWQSIWQAFFDLDLEMSQRKQLRILEGEIEDRVPERVDALPLLGLVIGQPLPENDFTRALDPQDRKIALQALLEDCLKSAAQETPLLIVLEDLHWIDPLSLELLDTLARVSANMPICFVLAYRPPDGVRYQTPRIEKAANFTKLELKNLLDDETRQLIRAKLAQLFPERTGQLPQALVSELARKAQGNPFFIEELLNYLHDRGLNPYDTHILENLDLPASLQTLILSRIDQLTEPQKVTLKVASVIGRIFPVAWLRGYYPALGNDDSLEANLAELSHIDLTPLDTPEPELAYLFKHIITQEVAYGSLSYATRAQLHELLARYLEQTYPDKLPLEILAFHYSHSENQEKRREYLRRSGEAAQAAFSNATALDYFKQALALSPDDDEKITLHLNSGTVYQLMGNREDARHHYLQAYEIATNRQWPHRLVDCEIKLGNAWTLQTDYSQALEWLEKAHAHAIQANKLDGICEALGEFGIVHWRLANYETARQYLEQSLDLARQLGDRKRETYVLSVLAQNLAQVGDLPQSHRLFEEALAIARETNDKRRISGALTNYANTYYYEGDYDRAQQLVEEGLAAVREIGDKRGTSILLNNLGNLYYMRNDFETASKYYQEALALGRELDDKYLKSLALCSLGITVFRQGHFVQAELFYREAMLLNREMGDKVGLTLINCYMGLLALAKNQTDSARTFFVEGLAIAHQSNVKPYIIYNLVGLACYHLATGRLENAVKLLSASSSAATASGLKMESELQEPYDNALAETRQKLAASTFDVAWKSGSETSLDEIVQVALKS
jgi:predicted ATPase/class 3 adenylate cyclase